MNRWFFVALLLPALLAIGASAVSLFFADVSYAADLTEANIFEFFGKNLPGEQLAEINRSIDELPMHPFILVLIGGTLAGLTINGIAGFGEELGWRGLLLREWAPFGFWKSSILIGVVWGLWHLPFIIHGHNYPGHPVAGVFMMILWTVLFSPLIAYVCIRSNSVISAAIMHGAINGTAIAPALVLKGGDSLQSGVMGMAGILVLIVFNVVLIVLGKPGEWHDQWKCGNKGSNR
jgi:membrane protease YdiL (CAAX protease family)